MLAIRAWLIHQRINKLNLIPDAALIHLRAEVLLIDTQDGDVCLFAILTSSMLNVIGVSK